MGKTAMTTVARGVGVEAGEQERVGRLPHLAPLDGLRGIAIALVLGVHSGNSLWPEARGWLAPGGPLGVHLFFVLSGFLITALLLGEQRRTGRIDLRAFARRRVLRLGPVVVALALALVVLALVGDRLLLRDVLAEGVYVLTFTGNVHMVHGDAPPVRWLFGTDHGTVTEVGHMWSVGIEAQFYVLWAVVLWAVSRARWSYGRIALLTAGLVLAVAVWRAHLLAQGEPWLQLYLSSSTRLDAPFVGSLVGVAWCAGWLDRVRERLALTAGVLGLGVLLVTSYTTRFYDRSLYQGLYTVLALCAAAAIVGALRADAGSALPRALAWPPLVFLGTISYSVYVWHYGIFWTIERRDPGWPGPVRLAVGLTTALAVSYASYRIVEQPFLRRKRRTALTPAAGAVHDG
ncbi:MAG TPA: acyltransferase [Acidimicrobiales bacterium]|nr:acyltransferase [Acidimicrobiales bacterium]